MPYTDQTVTDGLNVAGEITPLEWQRVTGRSIARHPFGSYSIIEARMREWMVYGEGRAPEFVVNESDGGEARARLLAEAAYIAKVRACIGEKQP